MKKLMIMCLMVLGIASGAHAHATDNLIQAQSAWTNQSGSTLYIDSIDGDGLLTGSYINRAKGYACQNISYPVTGWVYQSPQGLSITFTTIWQSSTESCNSITAWTGFFSAGQIQTLWQLVSNGSSSTSQILQGSDTFSSAAKKTHQSLQMK